jgi:hypothetical protein
MIAMFRIDLRNWRGNPSTASATSCSNSRRRTSVLLVILQSPSPLVQASPGEQSCQRWDRPQTPSALRASKSALPVYGIASCGAGPAPARAALGHLRSGRCGQRAGPARAVPHHPRREASAGVSRWRAPESALPRHWHSFGISLRPRDRCIQTPLTSVVSCRKVARHALVSQ